MTIVINVRFIKKFLTLVGTGACGYAVYRIYQELAKERRETDEHREKVANRMELEHRAYEASINNSSLNTNEKTQARVILEDKVDDIRSARSIRLINARLTEFNKMISDLTEGTTDQITANLKYHQAVYLAEVKRQEREDEYEHDKELARIKANAMKDSAMFVADAVTSSKK